MTHVNGLVDGDRHAPFTTAADENGQVVASWSVPTDDSFGSILMLTGDGSDSGLSALTFFNDPVVTVVDDAGADDEPGQKDLSQLSVDNGNLPTSQAISWNWDDTAWTGKNTGDACSLIDTDGDGRANYSLCVTIGGSPASYKSTRLYSCGDARSDRCSQPTTPISSFTSTCNAAVVANSDPFRTIPGHIQGNTCDANPGCYSADTVAACTVRMADFGNPASAFLINVCSYPSQEPNSDPSECVVTPNNGFLTIRKVDTLAGDTTAFTFNLGAGQTSQNGTSSWTINGSGAVNLISFAPGTTYDLSEVVPSGWSLDSASCTANGNPTGTKNGNTIESFSILSGQETVCTFTDSRQKAHLLVIKHVVNDNGGTAGATDFKLHCDGTNVSPASFLGQESPGQTVDLHPGFYNVHECDVVGEGGDNCPSGYTASLSAGCSGTIAAGETKTCTITNDDQPGRLVVIKHVINDNGGTAVAADFTINVAGSSPSPASFPGNEAGTGVTINAGSYGVSEPGVSGYTTSFSADCTGAIHVGATKTCTVTNDDIPATLTVIKVCLPSNDSGLFNLKVDNTVRAADAACGGTTGPVLVNAGTHSVSESMGTGTNASDYLTPVIGGDCASTGYITLGLAQNAACTITNTRKARAKVVKTISQGPTVDPNALSLHTFTFQLRQSASTASAGTILETQVIDVSVSDTASFSTGLVPGATYQMCETVMPGWMTTLGPPFFVVYNPSGDNSTVCTDFTAGPGEIKTFQVDNIRPPGGLTRTIGFWKNWASCANSNGNQAPVLDQTLAGAGGHIFIGLLDVDNCVEGIRILNKSTVGTGKKMSSDPAFNLAAQLMAARLNVAAGADVCPTAITAINDAQALLAAVGFDGNTHLTMTAARIAQANALATTLDKYNNDNTALCAAP